MGEGMRVLITGGCGFIGSHLVEACLNEGFEVKVVDNLATGILGNVVDGVEYVFEDVRSPSLKGIMSDCDMVFHLAALTSIQRSIEHPKDTFSVNVEGTVNVLEAAKGVGVDKVVFASSSSVYGYQSLPAREGSSLYPRSPYGVHKVCGELLCEQYSLHEKVPVTCLRYFNVYGPRQIAGTDYGAVVPKFIGAKNRSVPAIIYGDGKQTRNFTYVKDAVRATLLAAKNKGLAFEIFNVAGEEEVSVLEIHKIVGSKIPPFFEEARKGEVKRNQPCTVKASFTLDWRPEYSITEGIKETIDESNGPTTYS